MPAGKGTRVVAKAWQRYARGRLSRNSQFTGNSGTVTSYHFQELVPSQIFKPGLRLYLGTTVHLESRCSCRRAGGREASPSHGRRCLGAPHRGKQNPIPDPGRRLVYGVSHAAPRLLSLTMWSPLWCHWRERFTFLRCLSRTALGGHRRHPAHPRAGHRRRQSAAACTSARVMTRFRVLF